MLTLDPLTALHCVPASGWIVRVRGVCLWSCVGGSLASVACEVCARRSSARHAPRGGRVQSLRPLCLIPAWCDMDRGWQENEASELLWDCDLTDQRN